MSDTPSNTIFVMAAISVIIFSLIGVGVMTGIIPSLTSKSDDATRTRTPTAFAAVQAPCAECARVESMSLIVPAQPAPASSSAPERNVQQQYEVVVRLPDGTSRTYSYDLQPAFRVGDTVRLSGDAVLAH
jgi:hypothetical protein